MTKIQSSLSLVLCIAAGLATVPALYSADDSAGKPAAPRIDSAAYRIGAGDVLQVSVWKEPEASSPDVVVRYDGRISLPLVREIQVQGLTPMELEASLVERLTPYINKPDVTVLVKAANSKRVFLLGAVKKEGPIPMLAPMTVLGAITEAGGLTDYAKQKKIYVLRSESGRQIRVPFDYQAVIRGQRIEQNILLLPGDTVVVPR